MMIRFRAFVVTAITLLCVGCASPVARLEPLGSAAPGPYRLGAGDEVRVTVFGLDAVNNSYAVGDAGTISAPLLGAIPAAGRTVVELEADIAELLRARELVRAPSVSVQVQKYRPFFILGEVQRPGQYPYVPGMTMLTAVSIAGGFTFRAETKRASITRPGAGAAVKGAALPETLVLPGDTINIHEAWF